MAPLCHSFTSPQDFASSIAHFSETIIISMESIPGKGKEGSGQPSSLAPGLVIEQINSKASAQFPIQ